MIFGFGSPVFGTSGKLGEVDRIMFDPNTQRAEHLVVKYGAVLGGLRVVPFHDVTRVDGEGVHVDMDEDTFGCLSGYNNDVNRARNPDYVAPLAEGFQMDAVIASGSEDYLSDKPMGYPGSEQRVPDDQQLPAIGRRADVFDAQGEKVGDIGDLSVESETAMAARIVVRRGLIFKNDFEIPLDWLDGWSPRGVGLKVPKSEMETLTDT